MFVKKVTQWGKIFLMIYLTYFKKLQSTSQVTY